MLPVLISYVVYTMYGIPILHVVYIIYVEENQLDIGVKPRKFVSLPHRHVPNGSFAGTSVEYDGHVSLLEMVFVEPIPGTSQPDRGLRGPVSGPVRGPVSGRMRGPVSGPVSGEEDATIANQDSCNKMRTLIAN